MPSISFTIPRGIQRRGFPDAVFRDITDADLIDPTSLPVVDVANDDRIETDGRDMLSLAGFSKGVVTGDMERESSIGTSDSDASQAMGASQQ